jgi:hypothetical protein
MCGVCARNAGLLDAAAMAHAKLNPVQQQQRRIAAVFARAGSGPVA